MVCCHLLYLQEWMLQAQRHYSTRMHSRQAQYVQQMTESVEETVWKEHRASIRRSVAAAVVEKKVLMAPFPAAGQPQPSLHLGSSPAFVSYPQISCTSQQQHLTTTENIQKCYRYNPKITSYIPTSTYWLFSSWTWASHLLWFSFSSSSRLEPLGMNGTGYYSHTSFLSPNYMHTDHKQWPSLILSSFITALQSGYLTVNFKHKY